MANGIKRMSAVERDCMMGLGVADQIVTNVYRDMPEERYGLVPYFKRDLRLTQTTLERLIDTFTDSIPQEQKRAYANTLRDGSYTIGVRCRATRNNDARRCDEYGMYLTFTQINVLLESAKTKCEFCTLDTEGQRRCKLRKALDEIPNDVPDERDGRCPYYKFI